jgi:hypothetical protein
MLSKSALPSSSTVQVVASAVLVRNIEMSVVRNMVIYLMSLSPVHTYHLLLRASLHKTCFVFALTALNSPLGVTAKVTTLAYHFWAICPILKWPPRMRKRFKFEKTKTWYTSLVALLAQLAEQLTLNQRVAGSSPAQGIASKKKASCFPILRST